MRVIVTGAAGFIGSHVVDTLLEQGDDVVALEHPDATLVEHLGENAARVTLLRCDLHDETATLEAVKEVAEHPFINNEEYLYLAPAVVIE